MPPTCDRAAFMEKEKSSSKTPLEIAAQRIEEARWRPSIELDLSVLGLTELPDSLGQLTQLQRLILRGNRLTALPDSLGQLTQLWHLFLSDNQLTALPDSLGQLTQLRSLDLSNNRLTVLPDSLGQLPPVVVPGPLGESPDSPPRLAAQAGFVEMALPPRE